MLGKIADALDVDYTELVRIKRNLPHGVNIIT